MLFQKKKSLGVLNAQESKACVRWVFRKVLWGKCLWEILPYPLGSLQLGLSAPPPAAVFYFPQPSSAALSGRLPRSSWTHFAFRHRQPERTIWELTFLPVHLPKDCPTEQKSPAPLPLLVRKLEMSFIPQSSPARSCWWEGFAWNRFPPYPAYSGNLGIFFLEAFL